MLNRYAVGKSIKSILDVKENKITLLLDDGTIVNFSQFEDEIIFDIELPNQI
jgi:membrane protease subunit (stomatin/prohibitin family)